MRALRVGLRVALCVGIAVAALAIARGIVGLTSALDASHPTPAILLATLALGGGFALASALRRKTVGRSGGEAP